MQCPRHYSAQWGALFGVACMLPIYRITGHVPVTWVSPWWRGEGRGKWRLKNRNGIKPPPKKMVILFGYIVHFPRIQKIWMHFNKRQSFPTKFHDVLIPGNVQRFQPTFRHHKTNQPLGVVGKEGTFPTGLRLPKSSILPKTKSKDTPFLHPWKIKHVGTPKKSWRCGWVRWFFPGLQGIRWSLASTWKFLRGTELLRCVRPRCTKMSAGAKKYQELWRKSQQNRKKFHSRNHPRNPIRIPRS